MPTFIINVSKVQIEGFPEADQRLAVVAEDASAALQKATRSLRKRNAGLLGAAAFASKMLERRFGARRLSDRPLNS